MIGGCEVGVRWWEWHDRWRRDGGSGMIGGGEMVGVRWWEWHDRWG